MHAAHNWLAQPCRAPRWQVLPDFKPWLAEENGKRWQAATVSWLATTGPCARLSTAAWRQGKRTPLAAEGSRGRAWLVVRAWAVSCQIMLRRLDLRREGPVHTHAHSRQDHHDVAFDR